MAMTGAGMKALVKAKIEAVSNFPQAGTSPVFIDDRILEALCEGIVEHIQGNAVVTAVGADPQGGSVNSTGTVA